MHGRVASITYAAIMPAMLNPPSTQPFDGVGGMAEGQLTHRVNRRWRWLILVTGTLCIFCFQRPVTGMTSTQGKGQQEQPLPPQRYDAEGRPLPADLSLSNVRYASDDTALTVPSTADLAKVLASARPGQVIELAPGTHPMLRSLRIHNGGLPGQPIVVRARLPGSVVIESAAAEGFHLHGPWWVFENLVIRGVCKEHSSCEHAFHVVGKARNVVIRNNRIENFNAQIKVNGIGSDFPDGGLVQFNTLGNTTARITGRPVTPVDIVAASHWVVADNLVRNFVKSDGNQISYGAFMKGGGSHGRIERNLVICTSNNISRSGAQVGLSLGGGSTDKDSCRDRRCNTEHDQGTIADNTIAHCNDFGIYINSASQSTVRGNTLLNTHGIDVRFSTASALIQSNTLDGTIRTRDGATMDTSHNRVR